MKKFIMNYINNEKGLVTIEWVGIAAVVVLAAVLISSTVMKATASTATSVDTVQTDVGTASSAGGAAVGTNLSTNLTPTK